MIDYHPGSLRLLNSVQEGVVNANVDALSHLPLQSPDQQTPQPAEVFNLMEHLSTTPLSSCWIKSLILVGILLSRGFTVWCWKDCQTRKLSLGMIVTLEHMRGGDSNRVLRGMCVVGVSGGGTKYSKGTSDGSTAVFHPDILQRGGQTKVLEMLRRGGINHQTVRQNKVKI